MKKLVILCCLVIALAMTAGMLAACDGKPVSPLPETTAPELNVPTDPTSPGPGTTDPGTEPKETVEATEPDATAEVTDPITEPTVPATEPDPTDPEETTIPPTDPTEPVDEPTEPVTDPTQPTQPSTPTDPPHTHKYEDTVVKPTCTEKGYTLHKCSCGQSYRDSETAPLGHSYTDTVVNPTCTEKGYTQHKCGRCSHSYTDAYTDPKGHSWGEWKTVKEPTTEEEGVKERSCGTCSAKEQDSIPKKEAEYIDIAALEEYGRSYAVNTYGYDIDRSLNTGNAGYYPAYTFRANTLEDAKRGVREVIDSDTAELIALGSPPVQVIDGVTYRARMNILVKDLGNNTYKVWFFYG